MSAGGACAGSAGGYCGREGVVLVDVGGTLDDAHVDEHAGHEAALLGGSNVTLGTRNLLSDSQLGAGGEGTGSGRVDDGSVWASSVGGDDVDGTGDGATWGDLREGAAGESHNLGHVSHSVGTGFGLSESVSCSGLGVEDGGVDFGLLVGSGTWDDGTLDTEASGVSTGITSLWGWLVWMNERIK